MTSLTRSRYQCTLMSHPVTAFKKKVHYSVTTNFISKRLVNEPPVHLNTRCGHHRTLSSLTMGYLYPYQSDLQPMYLHKDHKVSVMQFITLTVTEKVLSCEKHTIYQRFSNFFQVGTIFISQNVLRTTLLLNVLSIC